MDRLSFYKTTKKYSSQLRKQRQDLIKDWFKQPTRRFITEDLAIHLIMDSRTVSLVEFKSRLDFKNQDPIMTQEQSVLRKIKETFSTEEISFQHFVLGYRIDEGGHNDRDLETEIER